MSCSCSKINRAAWQRELLELSVAHFSWSKQSGLKESDTRLSPHQPEIGHKSKSQQVNFRNRCLVSHPSVPLPFHRFSRQIQMRVRDLIAVLYLKLWHILDNHSTPQRKLYLWLLKGSHGQNFQAPCAVHCDSLFLLFVMFAHV